MIPDDPFHPKSGCLNLFIGAIIAYSLATVVILYIAATSKKEPELPPRDIARNVYKVVKTPDFKKTTCWKCHRATLEHP